MSRILYKSRIHKVELSKIYRPSDLIGFSMYLLKPDCHFLKVSKTLSVILRKDSFIKTRGALLLMCPWSKIRVSEEHAGSVRMYESVGRSRWKTRVGGT